MEISNLKAMNLFRLRSLLGSIRGRPPRTSMFVVGDPFHGLQQLSHLLRGLHVDQSSPQGCDGLVGLFRQQQVFLPGA